MTAAVHDRDFVRRAAAKFGNQCIVVAIDAKQVSPGAMGNLHPWRAQADRSRRRRLREARSPALGAGEILLTSMDRDGTKSGFDHRVDPGRVRRRLRCPVVASGGVGTLDDLVAGCTRRRRHRGARSVDLSFRGVHHRPGQTPHGRRRGLPMRPWTERRRDQFHPRRRSPPSSACPRQRRRVCVLYEVAARERPSPGRQEVRRRGGGTRHRGMVEGARESNRFRNRRCPLSSASSCSRPMASSICPT